MALPIYKTIKPSDPNRNSLTTTGGKVLARRMLGEEGGDEIGASNWIDTTSCTWKSFSLRPADQGDALSALVEVDIEVSNELQQTRDPLTKEVTVDDTMGHVIATLKLSEPIFSFEEPYAYVRAVIRVAAGGTPVQVDLNAIGI